MKKNSSIAVSAVASDLPTCGRSGSYSKEDVSSLRMLVRLRNDFQSMRKRIDNRIGRKADGGKQNVEDRGLSILDRAMFESFANTARDQEALIEKKIKLTLAKFPIYKEWMVGVKSLGTISSGWLLSEFDIYKATTVSKMWQYCGLNPGMVLGKKRVKNPDPDKPDMIVVTDKLIRGDKLVEGFIAPFNKRLRVAICGVMADSFIKGQNEYVMKYYYPYKNRLENSEKSISEIKKGGALVHMPWKDAKSIHRHRAAVRYMVKMFLLDLYVQWRTSEGLPVREPYNEQYLGHKHSGATLPCGDAAISDDIDDIDFNTDTDIEEAL